MKHDFRLRGRDFETAGVGALEYQCELCLFRFAVRRRFGSPITSEIIRRQIDESVPCPGVPTYTRMDRRRRRGNYSLETNGGTNEQ